MLAHLADRPCTSQYTNTIYNKYNTQYDQDAEVWDPIALQ